MKKAIIIALVCICGSILNTLVVPNELKYIWGATIEALMLIIYYL